MAIDNYTEGIKSKSPDRQQNAVLYTNRAAAQYHLGNETAFWTFRWKQHCVISNLSSVYTSWSFKSNTEPKYTEKVTWIHTDLTLLMCLWSVVNLIATEHTSLCFLNPQCTYLAILFTPTPIYFPAPQTSVWYYCTHLLTLFKFRWQYSIKLLFDKWWKHFLLVKVNPQQPLFPTPSPMILITNKNTSSNCVLFNTARQISDSVFILIHIKTFLSKFTFQ